MIRFIRNLILSVVIIALVAWIAALIGADRIAHSVQEPLTNTFIAPFGPGPDDEYGYNVRPHFFPPSIEVTDLNIEAEALRVDGSVFHNCVLSVDSIVCDFWDLVYYRVVTIEEIEGRRFQGGLYNAQIAERITRESSAISDVTVDWYNGMVRIQGRFGFVGLSRISLLGQWGIDDRGVVTLVDRQYHNPDSPVPEGAIRILEEQTDLDIRIELLGEELIAEELTTAPFGILIVAHD